MYFSSLSSVIIALGLVVAAYVYSHMTSSATIYTSLLQAHVDGSDPAKLVAAITDPTDTAGKNSETLHNLAHEGIRCIRRSHSETFMWMLALAVLAVLSVVYGRSEKR